MFPILFRQFNIRRGYFPLNISKGIHSRNIPSKTTLLKCRILTNSVQPKTITAVRQQNNMKKPTSSKSMAGSSIKRKDIEDIYEVGIQKLKDGDINGAFVYFDELVKCDPKNYNAHHFRAMSNYLRGDFQEAIRDFTTSVIDDTVKKIGYYNRAMAFIMLEQYEAAINDFSHSLLYADPDKTAPTYERRGQCYSYLKRFDEALEDFQKSIDVSDGQYLIGYIGKGRIFVQYRQFDIALENFQKAKELCPRDEVAIFELSKCLILLNRPIEALEELQMGITLTNGKNLDLLRLRESAYRIIGEIDCADQDLAIIHQLEEEEKKDNDEKEREAESRQAPFLKDLKMKE